MYQQEIFGCTRKVSLYVHKCVCVCVCVFDDCAQVSRKMYLADRKVCAIVICACT